MDCDRTSPTPDPAHPDPVQYATQYLGQLRDLAVQPRWISLAHIADPPGAALRWIGLHIPQINRQLTDLLTDLLDCFAVAQRPALQIFAAPLAPQAGVDGFCTPAHPPAPGTPARATLIVDPGRIVPADWPGLVAHELAHGIAPASGHGPEFHRAITHLCLAQDLPLPPPNVEAAALSAWPPCRRNPHPERFWLGQTDPDSPTTPAGF